MVEAHTAVQCSACGTPLSRERWSAGLCPGCLIELALEDTSLEVELVAGSTEAPTLAFTPGQAFSEGDIQGERYRMRALLGRGGMGEVWRAYDLKLRQDVALKALRKDLVEDSQALETLRQEVRTAREVISPNVCRVFDLQELDGQELVAMEYVDGTTLQAILQERSPLELEEAREIASQFLAGLEAIHAAGLVHRDIKPENVMVTRTGRVVVMDFGIAKGLGDGKSGMIAGTPAYMSPEQHRGQQVDARSDVFAAGVVLAEMVAPGGVRSIEARREVWEGIHQAEPQLSETPWSRVIAKAVSAQTDGRYDTASALARALEEVTLRAAGDETAHPYPGLSAFQQENARFFFGRELEVESLWKKLRRPHLLAVIGPSGAGKSSFLRAGLLPTLTDGWQAIVMTPGSRPFGHLAQALAEVLSEAPGVAELLARIEEPGVAVELFGEWRRQANHALLIVDQFEELFTQNGEDVRQRFADLLGQLPLETDLFVLLSMRDDFLHRCSELESLAPVFSELSPLRSLSGVSLRRALVEPALKCGYRFEDEGIVEEMLAEVEGERGALPMVAFAAAQLWERRDREAGLLTEKAYEQIGGVGGALAQHAEAILDYIGEANVPIVRELFRNLVTAQGTRASRDRDELLSVFSESEGEPFWEPSEVRPTPVPKPQRPAARHVLDTLIDARLLTSYEVPAADPAEAPHQRVEIVHESLLKAWPRLVRWQRQDADSAQLRDELRSQARLWDDHGRSVDYLWTGTAYREFQLWRERYPGGLTSLEEAYARAMTVHAERRKRRRRVALAAAMVVLLGVSGTIFALWRQAVRAEREAVAEARRAEASKLLALAQLELETDPTEALAYTTASLELTDSEKARVLALRILWEVPAALEWEPGGNNHQWLAFSPEARRLAVAGFTENIQILTAQGESGDPPIVLSGHAFGPIGPNRALWSGEELLATGHHTLDHVRVWSFPGGELVRKIELGGPGYWQIFGRRLQAEVEEADEGGGRELLRLRSWQLPDGEAQELGTVDTSALGNSWSTFDASGRRWIYGKGCSIFYRPLPAREEVPDHLVGSHENAASFAGAPVEPDRLWTRDAETGEMRQWDLGGEATEPVRVLPALESAREGRIPDPSGRWALHRFWQTQDRQARVWDLRAWSEARPLRLRRSGIWYAASFTFHPEGDWLVVSTHSGSRLTFWPLEGTWPRVVDGCSGWVRPVAFSPDGEWLATLWGPGNAKDEIRLWPLSATQPSGVKTLTLPEQKWWEELVFDPLGRYLLVTGMAEHAYAVPLDGSPPRAIEGLSDPTKRIRAAISPSGRRLATAFSMGAGIQALRVMDLESGELREFDLPESSLAGGTANAKAIWGLAFADESTVYTAGDGGIRKWDLESGAQELAFQTEPGSLASMVMHPGTGMALIQATRLDVEEASANVPTTILDLATGATRLLPEFGNVFAPLPAVALDSSGAVAATGDAEGTIRVGRVTGGEPHRLVGHEGRVESVAISPDGRWIASTGEDNTLRLWPMPDLDKRPLHTLPREELIAKLESLTNIRVVRDPESAEGWSVVLDTFPGWQEVPDW